MALEKAAGIKLVTDRRSTQIEQEKFANRGKENRP